MTIEQKRYIGVYGIIKKLHQILLVKKTRGPYTGRWDLPGGGLEHGENIFQGLARELEEEVGLLITENNLCFWGNQTAITEDKATSFFHIGLLYEVMEVDEKKINHDIHCQDVGGAHWFEWDTLEDQQLTPFASVVVNKLKEIGNYV